MMNDLELLKIIDVAVQDSTAMDSTFQTANADLLDRYFGNPYGDEKPGRSKVVSDDVQDVVEADMPPLVRIFLGAGDVLKFAPNRSSNEADVEEAKQKTKYINWQVRHQPWSYPVISGWIKDAEIQKVGVVKYFMEEAKEVEEIFQEGMSPIEMTNLMTALESEQGVKSVTIASRGEENELGEFDVKFKVLREKKCTKIIGVPIERFIFSRNARDKDDAQVVGDIEVVSRGELLKRGYKRKLIDLCERSGNTVNPSSNVQNVRDEGEGGPDRRVSSDSWALEEVEIQDLYILVDYDDDGIAERRHILRSGDTILENEVFGHVPYAMMSSIMMPHKAIGRSRAEITRPTAKVKTAVLRGMMDNIYAVNNPGMGINSKVIMDDLLVSRPSRIVRSKDDSNPAQNMMPFEIPYVGDRALQVIQYLDQARAQTTGSLLPSQGLLADDLGKETATRFNGIDSAAKAKVELVARTMAETGFRQLFEGLAWLNRSFQNYEVEFEVLGEEYIVNPTEWKYTHNVKTSVGIGIGDDDKLTQLMVGFLQISEQLKAQNSPITDQVKIYNMLDRMVSASGLPETKEFFNNPEKPEELLLAENEALTNAVAVLQEQAQAAANPLAEAETIKAQASLIEAKSKQETDVAKEVESSRQFFSKLQEEQRQFNLKMMADMRKTKEEMAAKITEMGLKYDEPALVDAELDNRIRSMSTEDLIRMLA
jgi:hypothetical protein